MSPFHFSKLRPSKTRQHAEGKKIIIDDSFRLALLRGFIHIIQTAISVALIAMNLIGVYIGPSLSSGQWSTT